MRTVLTITLIGLLCATAGLCASADQKATQIVQQMTKASLAIRSLTADFTERTTSNGQTSYRAGKILLMKPLYLREDFWPADSHGKPKSHSRTMRHEILASNGKTYWQIGPDGKMYRQPASTKLVGSGTAGTGDFSGLDSLASIFFDNSPQTSDVVPPSTHYTGTAQFDGLTCRVLEDSETGMGSAGAMHLTLVIGPDNLMRRLYVALGNKEKFNFELHNVHTGVRLSKADFAFRQPSWAKLMKEPSPTEEASAPQPVVKIDAKSRALLQAAA
ncbi:MAG TPA: hypothetical protein VFW40_01170, partial [Capsulimonadaceae bacterium]|nr:hypothetical protein [Capsulimonadaceae bacterium]